MFYDLFHPPLLLILCWGWKKEEEAAPAGAGQNGEAAVAKVNGSTHYEENAERALEEAVQNGEEHNLDYIDEEDNEDEKPVSSPRLNR